MNIQYIIGDIKDENYNRNVRDVKNVTANKKKPVSAYSDGDL